VFGSVARVGPVLFFFGAMSPYSWFAAERIGELIPRARWQPVFAGGLFQASGRSSWGLDHRRGPGLVDCQQRAQQHGLGSIRWAEGWPKSDILVARAMAFADREGRLVDFALAGMRAGFLSGEDLGQLSVLQHAATRVGLDPDALAAAVTDPAIKAAVRAGNDHARSLGVFGVPTVAVGDALFWGDDRLLEAAAACRAGAG
jgi:2-hydroxychromene-2-carboxylate isomerase